MHTASSAKRTCSASASAWLCTATVGMPSSRHPRMMRSAISPRFAMRIFLNMASPAPGSALLLHFEQAVAVLDRLAVLAEDLDDGAGDVGLDLVHELHGLDDAERLAGLHCA